MQPAPRAASRMGFRSAMDPPPLLVMTVAAYGADISPTIGAHGILAGSRDVTRLHGHRAQGAGDPVAPGVPGVPVAPSPAVPASPLSATSSASAIASRSE